MAENLDEFAVNAGKGLCEDFPVHIVCAWIGNSEDVAKRHYLQVTDNHFQRAVDQKALQQTAEIGEMDRKPESEAGKNLIFRAF